MCQRCIKSKRICVERGAAMSPHFLIHDESSYASGKSKRPRGPRSSLTNMQPYFDLQTRALAYYLQYHLQTPKDVPKISGGLSNCISAWQLSGRACPMVDLALSSMALAVYSRVQQCPPAAAEASSGYHKLLRITRNRIAQLTTSKLDERDIDSCLLAVSQNSISALTCWSHTDGSMAIMKVWYDKLNHSTSTPIIKHTRRGLIRSCLLRKIPLPDWIKDGSPFGEHDDELFCDRILVRLVNLHRSVAELQQNDCLTRATIEELDNEIRYLSEQLNDWTNQIPIKCTFQKHNCHKITEPWPQRHFYSTVVYSYPQPSNASAVSYLSFIHLFSQDRCANRQNLFQL